MLSEEHLKKINISELRCKQFTNIFVTFCHKKIDHIAKSSSLWTFQYILFMSYNVCEFFFGKQMLFR